MTPDDDFPQAPDRPRGLRFTTIMVSVVVIAGTAIAFNEFKRRAELPEALVPHQAAQVGAPFTLRDQNDRQISDTSFKGRKRLMLFAAASERDRILAALQVLNSAREIVGPAADSLAYIWITTDPDNDNPKKLAAVLAEVGGNWTALTGNKSEIRTLMRAFFVPDTVALTTAPTTKGEPPAPIATAYLMDENGVFLSHRTIPPDPAAMALWLKQSL